LSDIDRQFGPIRSQADGVGQLGVTRAAAAAAAGAQQRRHGKPKHEG